MEREAGYSDNKFTQNHSGSDCVPSIYGGPVFFSVNTNCGWER